MFDELEAQPFTGIPTEDWKTIRSLLEGSTHGDLTQIADQARFLRLVRRGSAIEQNLLELWKANGKYTGAVEAFERAVTQNQILDTQQNKSKITVMSLHQLKGREYDAVVLVEEAHQLFSYRDDSAEY